MSGILVKGDKYVIAVTSNCQILALVGTIAAVVGEVVVSIDGDKYKPVAMLYYVALYLVLARISSSPAVTVHATMYTGCPGKRNSSCADKCFYMSSKLRTYF